jgi:hypothetical protein
MRRALSPLLLVLAACGPEIASDDFSFDAQDWTLEGQTAGTFPALIKEGNPHLCATDNGFSITSSHWRFVAPAKYHGAATQALGRRLTWDSKLSNPDDAARLPTDLFIAGRGITVVLSVPQVQNRSPGWTPFSVRIDESAGWRVEQTGELATRSDLESVLSNVTGLRIPGEWRNGPEESCIDNVYFGTP